jgi:hypothetical protein
MPTTLGVLAQYWAAGRVSDVERLTAAGDGEEDEYEALLAAADASGELLDGPGRRVVIVAESPDATEVPVPLADVVAVYVDTEDVDPAQDDLPDLGWFATQEIADLLR